jgi:uncharacterized protein (TIGR02118 family)
MIKSVGLLQRRDGLDPAGFRAHYEGNHVPLATRLLGFPGYQRNYPESAGARAELGLDGFSEFWFQDAAEIAKLGELMQGEIGAELMADELRFMNPPANQTYIVSERLYGERPAPGRALRALAIARLPLGADVAAGDCKLDLDETRVQERAIPGVIAALHSVPVQVTGPLDAATPAVDFIESVWLESREVLVECNRWREGCGAAPLSPVEESGTPILAGPYG